MAISKVSLIMDRISSATKRSPIAVFKTDDGKLSAVFAATVETQKLIDRGDSKLIGIYHKGHKMYKVKKFLEWHSDELLAV